MKPAEIGNYHSSWWENLLMCWLCPEIQSSTSTYLPNKPVISGLQWKGKIPDQ